MSKYKTMIREDIKKCDEFIAAGFAEDTDLQTLIGKLWYQLRFLWSIGSGRSRFDSQTGISGGVSYFIRKRIHQEDVHTSVL